MTEKQENNLIAKLDKLDSEVIIDIYDNSNILIEDLTSNLSAVTNKAHDFLRLLLPIFIISMSGFFSILFSEKLMDPEYKYYIISILVEIELFILIIGTIFCLYFVFIAAHHYKAPNKGFSPSQFKEVVNDKRFHFISLIIENQKKIEIYDEVLEYRSDYLVKMRKAIKIFGLILIVLLIIKFITLLAL